GNSLPASETELVSSPTMRAFTRRSFLKGTAVAAIGQVAGSRLASARGLLVDSSINEVVGRALETARKAGATYADCRLVRRRNESLQTREDHITAVGFRESYGVGVRVIATAPGASLPRRASTERR